MNKAKRFKKGETVIKHSLFDCYFNIHIHKRESKQETRNVNFKKWNEMYLNKTKPLKNKGETVIL